MSKCSWFWIAPATVAVLVLGAVAAQADVRPKDHEKYFAPEKKAQPGDLQIEMEVNGRKVKGLGRIVPGQGIKVKLIAGKDGKGDLKVEGIEIEPEQVPPNGPQKAQLKVRRIEFKGGKMVPGKESKVLVITKKADKEGKKGLKQGVMQVRVSVSEYWIGLECYPAPEVLRAHVKLPEGRGLVVENVVPEGPAAKAGVLKYDILLAVGDKPLGKAMDLIEAVAEAKGKTLSLEILRAGEPRKIAVTPAKRPKDAKVGLGIGRFLPPGGKMPEMQFDWKPGMPPSIRYRFVHPGTILPGDSPAQPPLPANLKIVIIKEGGKPAKAIVEMGDKKWEVTEKELDKLPENIRPHVARMLGGVPNLSAKMMEIVPDVVPFPSPRHPRPEMRDRLEKRFDQMHRHMEQLRKSIEELRDRLRPEEDEVEKDEVEENEK